jgi:hypothetical protein
MQILLRIPYLLLSLPEEKSHFKVLNIRTLKLTIYSDGIMAAALRLLTIPLLRTGGRGLEAHALPTLALDDNRNEV